MAYGMLQNAVKRSQPSLANAHAPAEWVSDVPLPG